MTINKGEKLETLKKNIRSVLISSKKGVVANNLQQEFKSLTGSVIPFKELGFASLHEFISSIPDVVRVGNGYDGSYTYYAVADGSTRHIKAMVSKQKDTTKKRKKSSSSFQRNAALKPHNVLAIKFFNYKQKYKPFQRSPMQSHHLQQKRNVNNNCVSSLHRNNEKSQKPSSCKVTLFYQGTENGSYQQVSDSSTESGLARMSQKNPGESHVYKNTLVHKSSAMKNLDENTSELVTGICKKSSPSMQKSVFEINDEVKQNLVTLLMANSAGIHSSKIATVYEEMFNAELPSKVVKYILDKTLTDCASVVVSDTALGLRYIIFPAESNNSVLCTAPGQQSAKVLSPVSTSHPNVHEPLAISEKYKIKVVSVACCDEVYVQLNCDQPQYVAMQKYLQEMTSSDCRPISIAQVGTFVLTSEGQRAEIKSVGKEKVKIVNIDTGVYDFVLTNQLYTLPPAVAAFKQFAILCAMYRPKQESGMEIEWQKHSGDKFREKYLEVQLEMRVIDRCLTESAGCSYKHSVIFYGGAGEFNINSRLMGEEKEVVRGDTINPFEFQPSNVAMLPNDEYFEICIFSAPNTMEVEACIIGEGYSDKLVELETSMWKYYSATSVTFTLPEPPPLGCVFAVLFRDACVRGKLISVGGEEGNVYLVDNGDTELVKLCDLKPLQSEFCTLPIQVVTLSLAGLEHSPLINHSEILDKLNDLSELETVVARRVRSCQADYSASYVELIDTHGEDDININQLCANLVIDSAYDIQISDSSTAVSACIAHVDKEIVYIQLEGAGLRKLQSCLAEWQEQSKNQKPGLSKLADHLYIGKLCLADISGKLFRVRIEKISDAKPRSISVFLIDVGKCQNVSRGSLHKIDKEDLLIIPPQVLCCALCPEVESSEFDGAFSYSVVNEVPDLTMKQVIMKMVELSVDDSLHLVSLWMVNDANEKTFLVPNGFTYSNPLQSSLSKKDHIISTVSSLSISNLLPCDSSSSSISAIFPAVVTKVVPECFGINPFLNGVANDASQVTVKFEDEGEFPGILLPVKVEDALSPGYLQLVPLGNIHLREILKQSITEYFKNHLICELANDDIKVGQVYALCYSKEDGQRFWHRVKIRSKTASLVSIYFIDYGICDVVTDLTAFRNLSTAFAELPPMIMFARMAGLESVTVDWPEAISTRFHDFVSGKQFYAHCLQVTHNESKWNHELVEVCLCDTSAASDKWLDDMLVNEWKCARYIA